MFSATLPAHVEALARKVTDSEFKHSLASADSASRTYEVLKKPLEISVTTPIQLLTLRVCWYVDLLSQVGEKNTAASNVTQFVEVNFALSAHRPRF